MKPSPECHISMMDPLENALFIAAITKSLDTPAIINSANQEKSGSMPDFLFNRSLLRVQA